MYAFFQKDSLVPKRRQGSGFTLAEVLVVVALLLILVSISTLGFGQNSAQKRGARVLAGVLADTLKQTRSKAVSSSVPTALVFPSGGGTKAHSQAAYVVAGEERARFKKLHNFASEYSQSCIFVGLTGASGETLERGNQTSKLEGFTAQDWFPSQDYQLIFLPSGAVTSNDLPLVDGNYAIVVAAGVEYGGGSSTPPSSPITPAPFYQELTAASEAYTILVSANTGQISVKPGLLASSVPPKMGWNQEPAQAPVFSNPPVGNPSISEIQIHPDPTLVDNPSGIDAPIRDGEHLSFRVVATDDQGSPLFCEIAATNDSGTSVEGFSANGPLPMKFDRVKGHWFCDWEWSAPPQDSPGTVYTITSEIYNPEGGRASVLASAAPKIEKRESGRFLISGRISSGVVDDLVALVNDDGSNFRALPYGENVIFSSNSVMSEKRELILTRGHSSPSDGTIIPKAGWNAGGTFNDRSIFTPDQSKVTVFVNNGAYRDLIRFYDIDSDTHTDVAVPNPMNRRIDKVRFSPDGRKIYYVSQSGNVGNHNGAYYTITEADWDGPTTTISNPSTFRSATGAYPALEISPRDASILTADHLTVQIRDTAGNTTSFPLPSDSGYSVGSMFAKRALYWSPDGSFIAYQPYNSKRINVLNAADLTFVRSVDLSALVPGYWRLEGWKR